MFSSSDFCSDGGSYSNRRMHAMPLLLLLLLLSRSPGRAQARPASLLWAPSAPHAPGWCGAPASGPQPSGQQGSLCGSTERLCRTKRICHTRQPRCDRPPATNIGLCRACLPLTLQLLKVNSRGPLCQLLSCTAVGGRRSLSTAPCLTTFLCFAVSRCVVLCRAVTCCAVL